MNNMKDATAQLYLESRPKQNGKFSVKIKITYNRKRCYYSTGIELTSIEYKTIMNGKRKTQEQKDIFKKLNFYLTKANNIINNMTIFNFEKFDELFFEKRNVTNSVSYAFDKYIEQLKNENRIGTAVCYKCAKNSILDFKKNLTFSDITANFLEKYESWMLQKENSKTTIGIYLRSLRAIYNMQNIDKSIYPFGEGKAKYSIPTGKNIKKALTIEDIAKIYKYEAPQRSTKDMAKDYWMFLYLCNGMNVKDFCLLKWKDIKDDVLTYKRAKTMRSKKESKVITVYLKSEAIAIIKKWGQPSILKDAFIFPHLKTGMTAEKERATHQQLTKIINKYIKKIAFEVGINKNVSTSYARHSFATVLKRSGATIEMISELLGHSSVDITENYLGSFEKEQIQKQTSALTVGF